MRRSTTWIYSSAALSAFGLMTACQSTTPVDSQAPAPSQTREGLAPLSDPTTFPVGTVVATYDQAVLSEIDTGYGTINVLRLAGTTEEMGDQYGRLLGKRIVDTWTSLMTYMGEEMGGLGPLQAERVVGPVLDRAYSHMEPFIAQEFIDEMNAIYDGANVSGAAPESLGGADLRTVMQWIIALTNTSDLNAFNDGNQALAKILRTGTSAELDAFYLNQKTNAASLKRAAEAAQTKMLGRTCSFFAAWGQRTEEGKLFASRNLDWSPDTGIAGSALITIYRPENAAAYATFGYTGLIGALAGMSENGLVIGEVGSTSVLESLKGEPWTLRFREVLANADSLDAAIPYMTNEAADQVNRPMTLGYNFMVADGDPEGQGANAQGAVFESNGGVTSVFKRDSSCQDTPTLYSYGHDGRVSSTKVLGSSSLVNPESSAKEIDADGNVRTFQVKDGEYVRDAEGYLVEDVYGEPIQTGKTLNCTLYRGDEALGYGTRQWQTAANGPSGEDPREVMIDSSSWNNRYSVMYGVLNALWTGGAYSNNGVTWVPAGSANRPVSAESAVALTQAAAMDENIMSVVYDATSLKVWLAYESGSGSSWTRAADNPYTEIDMAPLFAWE